MMINSDNTRFQAAATIDAKEADAFEARQVTIPVLMVTTDAADTLLAESGAQVCLKGDTVNVADETCDTNTIGAGLLAASRSGDLGLMCTFLNMGADVNYRDAADGKTALCIASKCGQPEALRILIERGADVNRQDADGKTALCIASEYGQPETLQKLIERGADVTCQDAHGKTAVDLAPELVIYTGTGYIPLQEPGIYTSENHPHSTCDACGTSPIKGPRWNCKTRSDFHLCDKCYMQHQGDGTYTYEKKIGDYTEEELTELNRTCRERALIEHGYPDMIIIEKECGYIYCKKDVSGIRITTGDLVHASENPKQTGTVTTDDRTINPYKVQWNDTGAVSDWLEDYKIEKIIVLQSWKELKSSIRKTLLEAGCLPSVALNNITAALCDALESEDIDLSSALVKALKTYTLGLKWEGTGSEKQSTGTEIENDVLAAALQEKVEFKKEEWETFQVVDLSSDSYIRVGNRYFKPAGAEVNNTDTNGKTPLIIASECGYLDMVMKLLEKGADVNYTDANDKTPLILASENGHLDIVKKLLEEGADVNYTDANGKTAVDLAASRFKESLRDVIQLTLREHGGLTSDELFRKNNIVGGDYDTIMKAVKESLEEAPQSKRMVGDLKDLRADEFADTANGLKQFLKVRPDWAPAKECAELEEEVHRLRDCPQCAKVQADVLKETASEGNALLLKTSEITARLAGDLVALQSARRTGNDKEEETRLEEQVKQTRKEIDDIGGWYYGCKNAPAVAWPESKVKHAWGTYGQPMCDGCKKYALDHSTISADLNYCLHEVSSEKVCFNGVRDKGRAGKTIDYFVELPEAKDTGMNKPEAASLRFYSSHSFGAVTNPLRDPTRETEHPLATITYCIDQAIRKQLKWGAKDKNAASQEKVL
jgi:ankyrin repeat protein